MDSTPVLTVSSLDLISTELLAKIYHQARVKPKPKRFKYPPLRKHYNIHLFG